MRLVVELVAEATQQKETHVLSYADILSFMIQCVVDIAVYCMSLYTMYMYIQYIPGQEINLQHLVSNTVTSAHHSTTSMHCHVKIWCSFS